VCWWITHTHTHTHTPTHTHPHRRRGEVGFLSCVFVCQSFFLLQEYYWCVPICCSTSKSQLSLSASLSLSLSLSLCLSSSWVPQLQNPSSRFHLAGQAKQATPESQQTDQTRHHTTTQQDTHITPVPPPQQNKTDTRPPQHNPTRPQPYPTHTIPDPALPTHFFTYLPIYLPTHLKDHPPIQKIISSTHLIYLSIYLPIYLLTYPTKETFAPDHTRPTTFLTLRHTTYLVPTYPSTYLFIYLPTYLPTYLLTHPPKRTLREICWVQFGSVCFVSGWIRTRDQLEKTLLT